MASEPHWTDATDAIAATFFDCLTLAQLRRRQDLCSAQIAQAHASRNERALADLRRMEDSLMQAVMRRL